MEVILIQIDLVLSPKVSKLLELSEVEIFNILKITKTGLKKKKTGQTNAFVLASLLDNFFKYVKGGKLTCLRCDG